MKWLGSLSSRHRAATAASAFILIYALYACVQFALLDDVPHLLSRIADDASYYTTIARNVASGRGATFDGLHPTNGFHPLWLLMLVPLFLLHGTPETMIRLVTLLQTILLSFAYLVFLHTQRRLFSPPAAALSAILFVPLVFLPSINGMETALLILTLVILYAYGFHISQLGFNWRRATLLGVIVGFVLLTRLDMVFIPLALFGCGVRYALVRETRDRAIVMTAVCGLAAAIVVAPYVALNYWKFAAVMPISGALKSSFPHLALNQYTVPRIASMGIANLVFAALAIARALWSIAGMARARHRPDSQFYTTATTVFAWAIALHFLFNVFFMKAGAFGWYFVPYRLFAVVAVSGLLEVASRSAVMVARPSLFGLTAATLCVGVVARDQTRDAFPLNGEWHTPVYAAAVWAREHTPADAVFAMSDCGHFAFFSTRRVINLDGLVNNMDFQRTLTQHRLGQYLRDNHVAFLVQHAVHSRNDVIAHQYDSLELYFPSWRFDGLGDSISVTEQSEVYRSAPFVDGSYPSVLVIWSLGRTVAPNPTSSSASPPPADKPLETESLPPPPADWLPRQRG
jgi:hypothetical protein